MQFLASQFPLFIHGMSGFPGYVATVEQEILVGNILLFMPNTIVYTRQVGYICVCVWIFLQPRRLVAAATISLRTAVALDVARV